MAFNNTFNNNVPSDAIVLFGGTNFDNWHHGKGNPVQWTLADEVMTIKTGTKGISTRDKFCDVQLHIEWRSPTPKQNSTGQNDGNIDTEKNCFIGYPIR